MKIILVTGGWVRIPPQQGGGAEAYLFNLAKQLASMGHEVTVIDRKYSRSDPEIEYVATFKIIRLSSVNIKLFNYSLNFALTELLFGLRVRRWLKGREYDIIHLYISILGLALATGDRKIASKLVYGSHGLRRDKTTTGIIDRIAFLLENRLVKMVKKTTIANEVIAEKLVSQAKVKPEKVQVLHIGVDINQYNSGLDIGDVRIKYSLDGKTNILFVGRICVEKGVEYLVKAADIVINQLGKNKAQFIIVGPIEQFSTGNETKSTYMVEIIRLINYYGLQDKIKLTGTLPIDDLRSLYATCDMVVIPSVVDLDPQVQIEAMASGKPVIGTRVGTMPRRIKDGQSGFIVDPADEKQLADKINYLLDNPQERDIMGANARQIVFEKYSAEHMAVRMLEVFKGTA